MYVQACENFDVHWIVYLCFWECELKYVPRVCIKLLYVAFQILVDI